VEERVVRGARREVVRCFKCREEGHKCRECPLWEKKVKRVARPDEGKAHQKEKKREVRQVEEGEAARPVKGKAQQEKWKRSSWEVLRKRAKWYCGPTVLQDVELWELGWRGQGAICHKLHSAISSPILRRFPRSQSELKALQKTFRSITVTSRSDQYWPRY